MPATQTPWVPVTFADLTRPQQRVLEVIALHGHSWQSNSTHLGLNLVNSRPVEALMLRGLAQYKRHDGLIVRNYHTLSDGDAQVRGNGQQAVELTAAGQAMWDAAQ
jgi:hypothetical protein